MKKLFIAIILFASVLMTNPMNVAAGGPNRGDDIYVPCAY
jgi:hypothetical protein